MGTKERIVDASILLFNKYGERSVTTNHIAAHLGISPGNLYYHFKNKEHILRHIFSLYQQHLDSQFKPIDETENVLEQLGHYFDALFELMWQFHFFYDNMTDILGRDPELKADYIAFQKRLFEQVSDIVRALKNANILDVDELQIEELTHLLKLTVSFWTPYIKARRQSGELQQADICAGLQKILTLFMAFTTEQGRQKLLPLREQYDPKRC